MFYVLPLCQGAGLRDRDVEAIRITLLASEGRFGEASKLGMYTQSNMVPFTEFTLN